MRTLEGMGGLGSVLIALQLSPLAREPNQKDVASSSQVSRKDAEMD